MLMSSSKISSIFNKYEELQEVLSLTVAKFFRSLELIRYPLKTDNFEQGNDGNK